jgi:hypothetical protein
MGIVLLVDLRKPLAVWQNILLAIPIGAVGGALVGGASIAPFGIYGIWSGALVGGIIGIVTFPLAYATVGRTINVLAVVPAGLVAAILGVWIALGMLSASWSAWPASSWKLGVGEWVVALLLPIVAMFWACAWAAARERRKLSR